MLFAGLAAIAAGPAVLARDPVLALDALLFDPLLFDALLLPFAAAPFDGGVAGPRATETRGGAAVGVASDGSGNIDDSKISAVYRLSVSSRKRRSASAKLSEPDITLGFDRRYVRKSTQFPAEIISSMRSTSRSVYAACASPDSRSESIAAERLTRRILFITLGPPNTLSLQLYSS